MIGTPPLQEKKARELLGKLNNWQLLLPSESGAQNFGKIRRNFSFKNFLQAMDFANRVAEICEEEGHHADIFVSYRTVELTIFTHKINGLTESDFVLAAKIDLIEGK